MIAKHVQTIIGAAPIATFGADEVADLHKMLRDAGTGASVMNSVARILSAASEARQKRNGAVNPFDLVEPPASRKGSAAVYGVGREPIP